MGSNNLYSPKNDKKYLPGEISQIDTTEKTHTDTRSAKKDVIGTKAQKAVGAVRTFAREHKEKAQPTLLA